jgi:hypothetical protein
MNPVYIRVALYFIAPVLGLLPGVTFDAAAGLLTIDLETAAIGLAGSALFAAGVFGKWGKR